jgi:hypothetical protein
MISPMSLDECITRDERCYLGQKEFHRGVSPTLRLSIGECNDEKLNKVEEERLKGKKNSASVLARSIRDLRLGPEYEPSEKSISPTRLY